MPGEENYTPIEAFDPRDREVVEDIDAALAGYNAVLPGLQPLPDLVYEPRPMEIDRSPHPRHGMAKAIGGAALVSVNKQVI